MSNTVPCQCEAEGCQHDYLSVPAGKAASMYIGPVCDKCADNCVKEYLLKGKAAEDITEEVRRMYAANTAMDTGTFQQVADVVDKYLSEVGYVGQRWGCITFVAPYLYSVKDWENDFLFDVVRDDLGEWHVSF